MDDRKEPGDRGPEDAFERCLRCLEATTGQIEVARLVTQLYTNRGAAAELGISLSAVKHRRERLYKRLEVHSRYELAARIRKEMDKEGPRGSSE